MKFIFQNGFLFMMVNLITLLRLITAPVIGILFLLDIPNLKWPVLILFLTDALDGYLARRWKVCSVNGARLDSIADDLLFITCAVMLAKLYPDLLHANATDLICVAIVYLVKIILLRVKHRRWVSGLHTLLNKTAAVSQGLFLLITLFYEPFQWLFSFTLMLTILAIIEEIIIIVTSKELITNTKGILFHKNKPQ